MNWPWVVGMFILSVVPAIIGGGLFFSIFEQWTAVILWEIILFSLLMYTISKGMKKGSAAH
jgi:hypothetical protein